MRRKMVSDQVVISSMIAGWVGAGTGTFSLAYAVWRDRSTHDVVDVLIEERQRQSGQIDKLIEHVGTVAETLAKR